MRRHLALAVALSLLPVGCTDDGPEPDPEPAEEDAGPDDPPPQGVRLGIVLPPRDTGSADEVAAGRLGLDALEDGFGEELVELRTVVPDAEEFVPDVAALLAGDGYDVVCVLGRDAGDTVLELARRHAATEFCAAPVEPVDDAPDNVMLVDVALEELGHVVGVALAELGQQDPVALVGAGDRAAGEAFRDGVRAGVGATPLRVAHVELEQFAAELTAALEGDAVAVAVDAGPQVAELLVGVDEVPLLAPAPLFGDEALGALRWRVRWERVVEVVLDHHLEGAPLPARLSLGDGVFVVDHGDRANPGMVDAVEAAMGELERSARDPLAPPEPDEPEGDEAPDEDGGAGPEDRDGADAGGDAAGAEGAARPDRPGVEAGE